MVVIDGLLKQWDPHKHPRSKDGEFFGSGDDAETNIIDVASMQSPKPPELKWKAPPPPTPQSGGGHGHSSFGGITNTQLGDAVEAALAQQMGMKTNHPERRQAPLDLLYGKYGFEVKAVTTFSKEYKARPKKIEVEQKKAEAKKLGLIGGMMIVVVEPDGTGSVYWRPEIGAYQVNEKMNYAGTIKIDLPKVR